MLGPAPSSLQQPCTSSSFLQGWTTGSIVCLLSVDFFFGSWIEQRQRGPGGEAVGSMVRCSVSLCPTSAHEAASEGQAGGAG